MLTERGINYDVGTDYAPGVHSRPDLTPDAVTAELTVIRDDLHCTAVNLFGSTVQPLLSAAATARRLGLTVWVQPRLVDADRERLLAHLAEVADGAEALRREHGDIGLNVGCEFSIFAPGIIPGTGYERRAARLAYLWWLLPWFNVGLNRLLRRAVDVARPRFHGPITYGAGQWESVDWGRFDVVGLNAYRDRSNAAGYASSLRAHHRHGKPVIAVEFGCCTFEKAPQAGGSGDRIAVAEPTADGMRLTLTGDPVRSEAAQATYLDELIDMFEAENLHGAYVFEFVEPLYPHSAEPSSDLDMASFGIVRNRISADPPGDFLTAGVRWVPKAAFHRIARRFAAPGTGTGRDDE